MNGTESHGGALPVEGGCRQSDAPDTSRQKELSALSPIPHEYSEAWARVAASGTEDRMRRALLRIVYGSSCREAAREEGYASHQDVARCARRFGLLDASKARLLNGARRVAQLSQDELAERLTEGSEDIRAKDLAIIAGISIDKVARAEGWDRSGSEPTGYLSPLDRLVDMIREQGIELQLRVEPTPDRRNEIDVTPSQSRQGGLAQPEGFQLRGDGAAKSSA